MTEENEEKPPLRKFTASLISLAEASRISGLTPGYIRKLVRTQQIAGVKIGRNWLTTAEAVREYLKQERRPGPKPRQE